MAQAAASNGGGVTETSAAPAWWQGFREDYHRIFVDSWSPYVGAMLLVIAVAAFMVNGLFWGVFGGFKLWGDYFNSWIGLGGVLGIKEELESPLLHRISLSDIALLLGAFAAALMSYQFRLNRPPKIEYVWGALGGSLMGIGAALAGGCTTGGFFTPLIFSSPAGWAMWAGLLAGAYIGLKLLLIAMEKVTWGTTPPPTGAPSPLKRFYPWFGVAVVAGVLWWASAWYQSENERLAARAIIVLTAFSIGFLMHRSRLCFARVFREPFMTAEGDMTKAMILALALGIPVGSLLLQKGTVDPFLAIPASFWAGSLLGGLIFGIGMVFAGGCASGSLWRMGEGHLKLWVAAFFFSWMGSTFSAIGKKMGFLVRDINLDLLEYTKLGKQAYFPQLLDGWGWTFAVSFGILLIWYLWVRYNESTEKFTVL